MPLCLLFCYLWLMPPINFLGSGAVPFIVALEKSKPGFYIMACTYFLLEALQHDLLLDLLLSERVHLAMAFEDRRPGVTFEGLLENDLYFLVLDEPKGLVGVDLLGVLFLL